MQDQSILVYAPKITPRVEYTFRLIFEDLLGAEIDFTDKLEFYVSSDNYKINYSDNDLSTGVYFNATQLLFEGSIKEHEPVVFNYDGCPVFYKAEQASALPFDPFAAIFFMLSRYEEYYNNEKDEHNRYKSENSIACKHGFIEKPVVNIWIRFIKQVLTKRYPEIKFNEGNFSFNITIDIDLAYAHKHKGFARLLGSTLIMLFTAKWQNLLERVKTIAGLKKDVFDTYDYLFSLRRKYNFGLFFFILIGNKSEYDKNLSWKNKSFRKLIKRLDKEAQAGIHLSYLSGNKSQLRREEINRLSGITGKKTTRNRQHFLRMNIPETYQDIIKLGIEHDFTMGYADVPGFRSGSCTPYKFYDLQKECPTNLTIHPFAFMEGNFIDHLELSPKDSLQKIKQLIDSVKQVNGCFYSLWHNHSLSNIEVWQGWDITFEEMIKYSKK